MKIKSLNRRDMIKTSFAGLVGLSASSLIAACSSKKSGESEKTESAGDTTTGQSATSATDSQSYEQVHETDKMAQTLGYKKDASSVSSDIRVDKAGVKGTEQFCHNCQFYTQLDPNDATKGGKCSLFSGNVVKKDAWCKSWAKKQS